MSDLSIDRKRTVIAALASAAIACCFSLPSYAWGGFAYHHPRRSEVLYRDSQLSNQIRRDPYLSYSQRRRLSVEDNAIRSREQIDALRHGGRITPSEQRRLNSAEGRLHHQIYRDSRY